MARTARLLIPGAVYHVTARGNYRQQIFFEQADRENYLRLLTVKSRVLGLELLGWCLMPNHVHLLVREAKDRGMANTIRSVHGAYAVTLNRRLGQPSGHLWQGRYYSCPIPADRIWTVLRYVELNPVRAQLTATAADYEWSTARFHLGQHLPPPFLNMSVWSDCWTPTLWREALHTGINGEEEAAIREAVKRGRWEQQVNGAALPKTWSAGL